MPSILKPSCYLSRQRMLQSCATLVVKSRASVEREIPINFASLFSEQKRRNTSCEVLGNHRWQSQQSRLELGAAFQPWILAGEQMSRGPYFANQLRACSKSLGGKNLTGARRTHAPAKESAGVSQRGSATMAILEILPLCEKRKSRLSSQSALRSQP